MKNPQISEFHRQKAEEYKAKHGEFPDWLEGVLKINGAPSKRSKHGAVKTVVGGITFDSKAEANYYCELKMLERIGEIEDLRLQVRFPFVINGKKCGAYVADFVYYRITENSKMQVVCDVKSKHTAKLPLYRRSKAMMLSVYNITVEEVIR